MNLTNYLSDGTQYMVIFSTTRVDVVQQVHSRYIQCRTKFKQCWHKTSTCDSDDKGNIVGNSNNTSACSHGESNTPIHSTGSATHHWVLPKPESCKRYRWPRTLPECQQSPNPQRTCIFIYGEQHTRCHCLSTNNATVSHQTMYIVHIHLSKPLNTTMII